MGKISAHIHEYHEYASKMKSLGAANGAALRAKQSELIVIIESLIKDFESMQSLKTSALSKFQIEKFRLELVSL